METVVEIRDLTVRFPTKEGGFIAIQSLSMDIHNGERIAVMGESGCGKSVLGHCILGLLEDIADVTGSIRYDGFEIVGAEPSLLRKMRGESVALIPQSPSVSLNPVLSIGLQIDEMHMKAGTKRKDSKQFSIQCLREVGFEKAEDIYRTYPHRLSGGMCERAVIAMGSALNPKVLIADEPTKGLDPASKTEILKLLRFKSEGKTLLAITHDYHSAKICERIVVMYRGKIVEDGPRENVLCNPIHPYTRGLWGSMPENGLRPISEPVIELVRGGCCFIDRCQHTSEMCRKFDDMPVADGKHRARCIIA